MRKKSILIKILIAVGIAAAAVYASASTYIWARQSHFIFWPERILANTPADYLLPFEDIYITVAKNGGHKERIHAWWIPADNSNNRTLLYLHGSALNIAANINHARRFYRLGFSVLLVSYRGYGKSDGNFPSESQIYEDSRSAWRYLVNERDVDPGTIYLYGHSMGAAVAIDLAVDHPEAAGLITEAAFTSIPDLAKVMPRYRIFPIDLIVNQRFESIKKVPRLTLPVLYIHGTDDTLVPYEMSRMLYQQTVSPKSLKLILGGGHNNSAAVGGEEYLKAVRKFVEGQARPAISG
jgi:pimeloyl-ACP methyl ester carboxylesterase